MGGGPSLYCDYEEEWQTYTVIEVKKFHMENPTHVKTPHGTSGKLPIHYAVEHGASFEVVRMLTKLNSEGLKLKDNSYEQRIPLHYAAAKGNGHLIPYLLYEYPEGKDVKDTKGKTPLDLAKDYCFPDVIKFLENVDKTIKRYDAQEHQLAAEEKVRRKSQIIQAEENEEIQRLIAQEDKGAGANVFLCCGENREGLDSAIDQRAAFNEQIELKKQEDVMDDDNKETKDGGSGNVVVEESKEGDDNGGIENNEKESIEVSVPTTS